HFRNKTAFAEQRPIVMPEPEVEIVVARKRIVDANGIVIAINSIGFSSRPIIKVSGYRRSIVRFGKVGEIGKRLRVGVCNNIALKRLPRRRLCVVCGWIVDHITAVRRRGFSSIALRRINRKLLQPPAEIARALRVGGYIGMNGVLAPVPQLLKSSEEEQPVASVEDLRQKH